VSRTYRAYLPERFETVPEAAGRRTALIRHLGAYDDIGAALAKKLAACREGGRCRSGACPVCLRLCRIEVLREGLQVLESKPHWFRASIVPASVNAPLGDLNRSDLTMIVKTTRKRLERCFPDGTVVIGGVDISLNTKDNANPTWQPHLYLLVEGELIADIIYRLRRAFPPEPSARRPYNFRQIISHRRPLTYCFKSVFVRRSEYQVDGRSRIKDQPLTGEQAAELALFLDHYPIGERLILKGVRRAGHRWRLVP
jgi:hypothetical protein